MTEVWSLKLLQFCHSQSLPAASSFLGWQAWGVLHGLHPPCHVIQLGLIMPGLTVLNESMVFLPFWNLDQLYNMEMNKWIGDDQ